MPLTEAFRTSFISQSSMDILPNHKSLLRPVSPEGPSFKSRIDLLLLSKKRVTIDERDGLRTIDLRFVNRMGKKASDKVRPSTSSTLLGMIYNRISVTPQAR